MSQTEYLDFLFDDASIDPWSVEMGGEEDIAFKNISISLGRYPDLIRLRQDELAASIAIEEGYDYWLIRYVLAIRDDGHGGYKQVRWISLDTTYPAGSAVIVSTFPKQEFVQVASAQFSAGAGIDASGKLDLKDLDLIPRLDELTGVKAAANTHVKGSFSSQFAYSFYKKKIQATGLTSNYGFWQFQRANEPLLGEVGMHHIIKTPASYLEENRMLIEADIKAELSSFGNALVTQIRQERGITLEVGK